MWVAPVEMWIVYLLRKWAVNMKITEVQLSYKQKIILNSLLDEFHGRAYTKELLAETENEEIKQYSMPQITWALNALHAMALLNKRKGVYQGKEYTEYSISDYLRYEAVKIK